MFKVLFILLDLDGYTNLWNKYHDNSGMTAGEHNWTEKHWRDVFYQLLKERNIRKALEIRRSWYLNDWGRMYEICLETLKIEYIWAIS